MKGTKVSRTLAFNKIGVAQTLNMFGLDALMCDADVVWLRDPSHYFTGYGTHSILDSIRAPDTVQRPASRLLRTEIPTCAVSNQIYSVRGC